MGHCPSCPESPAAMATPTWGWEGCQLPEQKGSPTQQVQKKSASCQNGAGATWNVMELSLWGWRGAQGRDTEVHVNGRVPALPRSVHSCLAPSPPEKKHPRKPRFRGSEGGSPPHPPSLSTPVGGSRILPPAPLLQGSVSKQDNYSHCSPGAAPPVFI